MMWRTLFATVGVALLVSACGESSTGTNGNQGATANFSAKIDGVQWNSLALSTSAIGSTNGGFTMTGSNVLAANTTGLSLSLFNIGAPGTYPLGVGGTVRGGIVTMTNGVNSWSTALTGAAGSVTVTSVSGTRVAGTFSATLDPLVQTATGTKSITAGVFDLAVTSSGSVAVPDNVGSTVAGTLGGAPWNAAHVVMVVPPSSGTLTFGLSRNGYNINVIVSQFTGAASYTMGTSVARYVSVTSLDGGTKTWGGTNASTSGTLVVTSSTSTRVQGTFNVSMQPGVAQPGTGTLTFTGAFDIGIP